MSAPFPPDTAVGVVRRVAANSAWQVVSFACRAIAGLGVVVALARTGGPEHLGAFQFALTVTALLPYYWGFPQLLSREVARRPQDARRWIEGGVLSTLLIGSVLTVGLIAATTMLGVSRGTVWIIGLASVGMIFDGIARINFAAFVAWERMVFETMATAVQETVFLVAAVAVLVGGGGPREAMMAFLASRALGAAIGWVIASERTGGPLVPRPHGSFTGRSARAASPFAVGDILKLVQLRADVVMLGVMRGHVAVGLYQACTNLVLNWNVLARALNHGVYPRMSRAWPDRPAQFGRLRDAASRALAMIGMPVAVGGLLLAPELLRALYGSRFDEAVLAFRLLVLVVPLRMMTNTLSSALAACNKQHSRMVAVGIAAAANVGLNLIFIPRWSYVGSAVATLITETGLLLGYGSILRRAAGPSHMARAVAMPALACVPLVAVLVATTGVHLVVAILAGAAAYAGSIVMGAMVVTRREDRSLATAVIGLVRPS